MTIDPLTVWHVHDARHGQPLTRPLTPDLAIADVIPDVLDAARRERAGASALRWATRRQRRILRLTRHRSPLRVGSLTRATR
jgi:hypothetical protein